MMLNNLLKNLKNTRSSGENHVYFVGLRLGAFLVALMLIGIGFKSLTNTFAAVTVTPALGGTNISADTAANGTTPSYTTLSGIAITEALSTDIGSGNAAGTNSGTIILTAPTNWQFRPGSGSISNDGIPPVDIQGLAVSVTTGTITITITENGSPFKIDAFSISGIQVRPITGNLLSSAGNILRTCANSGTLTVVGITCDSTNFGSLSMTTGTASKFVVTLPGQTFSEGTGNSGTPTNQTGNTSFIITAIRAVDQFFNTVSTFSGAKTLSYSGPTGTTSFVTGVSFTSGVSTTVLTSTIVTPQTTTITVSGAGLVGTSSSLTIVTGATTSADLSITKSQSTGLIYSGTTVVYTLTYTNSGVNAAADFTVVDSLPSYITFVSASVGTYSGTAHTVTLTGGSFSANTSGVIVITGVGNSTITSGASIVNTGVISSSTSDPVSANNTATATAVGKTSSDVLITKSVNTGIVYSGTTVVYTVQYNNLGINSTTGTIIDTFPTGFTYQSNNGGGTVSGGQLRFTGLTFAVNTTGTIVITGVGNSQITNGLAMLNTITIASTQIDPVSANNTAIALSTGATTASADLSITKSQSTGLIYSGTNVVYTLTYLNSGANVATGTTLTDTLPSFITFIATSIGVYSGTTHQVTVDLGALSPNATGSVIITGIGNSTITSGISIINTGTISSSVSDPNSANNTATATAVGKTSSDVLITKSVNTGIVYSGTTVVYTVQYNNLGINSSTGMIIDVFPTGFTYQSNNGGGTVSGGQLRFTGLTFAVNTTGTIVITGVGNSQITSGLAMLNTVTITSTQIDPVSANNTATALSTGATTASADLSITKSQSTGLVYSGTTVVYTLIYTNSGVNAAADFTVVDTLPSYITFVSASVGTYSGAAHTLTLTGGSFSANTSGVIVITGIGNSTITSGASIVNTGVISSSTSDPVSANNTATATAVGKTSSDVLITKSVNTGIVYSGTTVVYTIQYNNLGINSSTGTITDTLPSGFTYQSNNGGGTVSGGQLRFTGLTFAVNSTGTIVITGVGNNQITSGLAMLNTVTIASTQIDPVSANNTATALSTGAANASADVSVTKTSSTGIIYSGTNVVYTLTYLNSGANVATGTTLTDTLPSFITFIAASIGVYSGTTHQVTVDLGALAPNASGSVIITGVGNSTITSGISIINTGTISSSISDPNSSNNTSTALSTGAVVTSVANVGVTKSVNSSTVISGGSLTYTIVYTNAGPDLATGFVLEDTLGTGLSFVSSTPTLTLSGTKYYFTGNIASGTTGTIVLTASVSNALTSGTVVTNFVTVTSSVSDNSTGNNSGSASSTVFVPYVDVSITKSVNASTVATGGLLRYLLSYINNGPYTAASVTVQDDLSPSLTFLTSSVAPSSNVGNSYSWSIGSVASGSTGSIYLTAFVNSGVADGTSIVNSGSISTATYENNTGNNLSTAASVVTQSAAVDLQVTKSVNSSVVSSGAVITYTVTYANLGSFIATGSVLTDTLDTGLSYLTSSLTPTTITGNILTFNLGNLGTGTSGSFVLTATLLPGQTSGAILNNVASLTSTVLDTQTTNNLATGSVTYQPRSDLTIQKTVNTTGTLNAGTVRYTLTYQNLGPDTAQNVYIQDALSTGTTFVSSSPSPTSQTGGLLVYSLGSLSSGASSTIVITGQVVSSLTTGFVIVNSATITGSSLDSTLGNNSGSVQTTVTGVQSTFANLSLTKVVDRATATIGQYLTYVLSYQNAGPNIATGTTLQDTFASGLTYVSATPSYSSLLNNVITWNLGNLLTGATGSVVFTASINSDVISGSVLVNTGTISSSTSDTGTSDNTSTASTTVLGTGTTVVVTSSGTAPTVGGGGNPSASQFFAKSDYNAPISIASDAKPLQTLQESKKSNPEKPVPCLGVSPNSILDINQAIIPRTVKYFVLHCAVRGKIVDGKRLFAPTEQITTREALILLMRIVLYPASEQSDSYSYYLDAAKSLGIIGSDIVYSVDEKLSSIQLRSWVAKILSMSAAISTEQETYLNLTFPIKSVGYTREELVYLFADSFGFKFYQQSLYSYLEPLLVTRDSTDQIALLVNAIKYIRGIDANYLFSRYMIHKESMLRSLEKLLDPKKLPYLLFN